MRNFSKTLISMAAVMAVGSAMAAGAMAETLTVSTTDAEGKDTLANGTVTISNVTPGKSQYTLLVVEGVEVTENDKTEIKYNANENTIVQIDQNDDGKPFDTIVVGTDLTKGATYQVRVGNNDGGLDEGYFTVPKDEEPIVPEVKTETIIIGDVDLKGSINSMDLTYLKRKTLNKNRTDGVAQVGTTREKADKTQVIIGDVDLKGSINSMDLTYLKRKTLNKNRTDGVAQVGTTIEVKVVE